MLANFMDHEFCLLDKTTVNDGYGDTRPIYREGARFMAGYQRNTSTEMKIAEQQGVEAIYTVVTIHDLGLHAHDRIKSMDDGAVFEVISDPVEPPKVATRQMHHYEFDCRRVSV